MFCQNCGSEVGDAEAFCARCGAPQRIEAGSGGAATVVAPTSPPYTPVRGGQADTTRWIGRGWDLVKIDLGNFVLMTIVMMLVGSAVPMFLQGAMTAGFQGACKKKLQGQRAGIGDLFQGFQFFGSTLAAHI